MSKSFILTAILLASLTTGCVSPSPTQPLSPSRRLALTRRAQPADQLQIELAQNTNGEYLVEKAYALPLGTQISVPLRADFLEKLGVPVIDVRLNDQLVSALVDTSSPFTLTDYGRTRALGLVPVKNPSPPDHAPAGPSLVARQSLSAAGRQRNFAALSKSARFGQTTLYRLPVGILDEQHGLKSMWWIRSGRIRVVLGNELFSHFESVTIDYPGRRLIFSAGQHRPNPGRLVAALPLIKRSGRPMVAAHLDGYGPVPVAIDTGSDFSLWLPRQLAEETGFPTPAGDDASRSSGSGKIRGNRKINLSGFELSDVPVTVGPDRPESRDLPFALLGSRVLKNYALTLDFKARKIYLEK